MQPDIQLQPITSALYARVSSQRQEEEQTIESQIAEIKARITVDGNILSEENIFLDDGWTGELLQRPALDRLRDAALRGDFQTLYVYDRGRISRVFVHQEIIIDELTDRNIKFISLHDTEVNDPIGKLMQSVQGIFHEYERVKIVERMRRGKIFKARSGFMINGDSLYGYRYIKKTDTAPVRYEINEEEAKIVRDIFSWVGNERISLREVIRRLYDLGVKPRKRKSPFWSKGPIVRMLRCKSYITGEVYYNKSESIVGKRLKNSSKYKRIKRNSRRARPKEEWLPFKVPVLLSDQCLFDRVQKVLDFNQKFAHQKRSYDYLLTGLIYCGCGGRRVGDGINNNNFYYRCADRIYKFPKKSECKIKGINAVVLDKVFWDEFEKIITNPQLLRQQAKEWLENQVEIDVSRGEADRTSDSLRRINEEELRYGKAYGAGALDFEQFKTLMKELNNKKHKLEDQLKVINGKMITESIANFSLDDIVEEAKKVIASFDLANKFKVIHDIITKVIVREEQKVEAWGKIPLLALNTGYEPVMRYRWIS